MSGGGTNDCLSRPTPARTIRTWRADSSDLHVLDTHPDEHGGGHCPRAPQKSSVGAAISARCRCRAGQSTDQQTERQQEVGIVQRVLGQCMQSRLRATASSRLQRTASLHARISAHEPCHRQHEHGPPPVGSPSTARGRARCCAHSEKTRCPRVVLERHRQMSPVDTWFQPHPTQGERPIASSIACHKLTRIPVFGPLLSALQDSEAQVLWLIALQHRQPPRSPRSGPTPT